MNSLHRPPSRGPLGRREASIASPDQRIWATSLACLGAAETADIARSAALPPEIAEDWSLFQVRSNAEPSYQDRVARAQDVFAHVREVLVDLVVDRHVVDGARARVVPP